MLDQALQIYRLSEMLAQDRGHHVIQHTHQTKGDPKAEKGFCFFCSFSLPSQVNVGTCSTENPFL